MRKLIVLLLAVCFTALGYDGWQPGQPVPEEIARISPPFEMPQFKRPVFKEADFNIADYGATPCAWDATERVLSTDAIRKAIEACYAAGGGRVVIPNGDWITGAVHLKSHVNLHLEEGAVLHFSDNPEEYLPAVLVRWEGVECYNYSPLIYAANCEDIAITGKGTLNGHGETWWPREKIPGVDRVKAAAQPLDARAFGVQGGVKTQRPALLMPWKSKNVLIEGVTLIDPPFGTVQPVYCENVIIRGITIDSRQGPDGDGIDVDSCKNVLIEYNDLQAHDDAVCLKSGMNQDGLQIGIPTENVVIRHLVARNGLTGSGGIMVGSEMSGGIRNVYVHDALFENCDRGIRFKSSRGRGGVVHNVYIEDVEMKGIRHEAFAVNTRCGCGSSGSGPAPLFRRIVLNRVRAEDVNIPIRLIGLPDLTLDQIVIKRSSFTQCAEEAVVQYGRRIYFDGVTILRSDPEANALRLEQLSDSHFIGMNLNRNPVTNDCSTVFTETTLP